MSSPSTQRKPAKRSSDRIRAIQAGRRGDFDIFWPFPRLPIELRLKIWELTLPGPQTHSPRNKYDNFRIEVSLPQNPVAVQICKESREVALQYYTLREHQNLNHFQKNDSIKYASYIDFKRDIVVHPNWSVFFCSPDRPPIDYTERDWAGRMMFFSRPEMAKIANLRIFSGDFSFTEGQLRLLLEHWLPFLKSLKNFIFTIHLLPDVKEIFESWDGTRRVVSDRVVALNELAMTIMEEFKAKQLSLGIVWHTPNTLVDTVHVRLDENQLSIVSL